MAELNLSTLKSETDKTFESLDITDGPNGVIRLWSPMRLSDELRIQVVAQVKHIGEIATGKGEGETSYAEFKALCVDVLALVSDKPEDLREYAEPLDYAEALVFLNEWNKVVGAGKSNSSAKSSQSTAKK